MATYGKDNKGDYKIRDDGTKVYRDSSNSKYFPTDYGGSAGWSTTGSTAAPKTNTNTSSGGGSAKSEAPAWLGLNPDGSLKNKGKSSSGIPQQAPSTPDEMLQYLWQHGLFNQTPYPKIPEYRPLEPDVLSFNQAQRRAEAQFNPLYDDLLKRVSTQSAQNLEQSGLFGSLYGDKLRQDAALNVENKRSADIAALANQLVSKSEEEARYLEQQNYGRWRDYVGDLVNQYSANRAAGQDQTALIAQMLGYLTDRDNNSFSRWLQGEQLGLQKDQFGLQQDQWNFQKDQTQQQTEWERSGFPSQYAYQQALAKLEASLRPKSSGSSSPYGDLDKTTIKNINISDYRNHIDNFITQSQRSFNDSYQAYKAVLNKINQDKDALLLGGLSVNDIEKLVDYAKKATGFGSTKSSNKNNDAELQSLIDSLYE